MLKCSLFLCAVLLALSATSLSAADAPAGKTKLVHVVALKFKEGTSADDIKKVHDAFRALKTAIPEIVAYEGGPNVSKEGKDKGFHHCGVLSFKSQKDLDTYVVHAAHQDFVKLIVPLIADVFVYDYWE